MYSVMQYLDFGGEIYYIFKKTDLETIEDGNKWIQENITKDIEQHWVIRTSDILRFSPEQFLNVVIDDGDLDLSAHFEQVEKDRAMLKA